MSSGPGTERLRASFTAGGWRYCLSSSVTPDAQKHKSYTQRNERKDKRRNVLKTRVVTDGFLTHHDGMLRSVARLKMRLVVAKSMPRLHHAHR